MGNAKILCEAARSAGLEVFGGTNAPYIWVKTPNGALSWDIFNTVLNEASVVITPGAGFGNGAFFGSAGLPGAGFRGTIGSGSF